MKTSWALRFAYRDGRASLRRLLLVVCSVVFGVAAIAAVDLFRSNLQSAVDTQAKSLLSADLVLRSRKPIPAPIEKAIEQIPGDQSRLTGFQSMISFPQQGGSRLALIRGIDNNFPFYGSFLTEPADATRRLHEGAFAVVDQSLLLQFDVSIGEQIRIGAQTFKIIGKILAVPGESIVFSSVAPRVYIPRSFVKKTDLLKKGSRINYQVSFRLGEQSNPDQLLAELKPQLSEHHVRGETVESRKQNLQRVLDNVAFFLSLAGILALTLGALGVFTAITVYLKRKETTIATLRCLGVTSEQILLIFLIQIAIIGGLSSLLGTSLGAFFSLLLPGILSEFLPVTLTVSLDPLVLLKACSIGTFASILFSLFPLLALQDVSPASALRSDFEQQNVSRWDRARSLAVALLVSVVVLFFWSETGGLIRGLSVGSGIAIAFSLLTLLSLFLRKSVRKLLPRQSSFRLRQGFRNLSRPQNQTTLVLLCVGFTSFLLLLLELTQSLLLEQVELSADKGRANVIFFDVQTDQKDQAGDLLARLKLPLLEQVPIVSMRLNRIGDRAVSELRDNPKLRIPSWVLRREYRSTYRDTLIDSEKLLSGSFVATHDDLSTAVPISLEKGIAKDLRVGLGDTLTFDIQGVLVETVVRSLREVDWKQTRPNFFVVFPKGVLEEAPHFFAMTTRVDSREQLAKLYQMFLAELPNVSAVDLSMILQTLDTVLSRLSFVVRFMGLFSIATGILILFTSMLLTQQQRVEENILLRIVGGTRGDLLAVTFFEYLFLALLGTLAGAVLAIFGTWAIAVAQFKLEFVFSPQALVFPAVGIVSLVVFAGLLGNSSTYRASPMEALRSSD